MITNLIQFIPVPNVFITYWMLWWPDRAILHFRCLKSRSFASPFRSFALSLFRTFASPFRSFASQFRCFAVSQFRTFVLSQFRTFAVSHFRCFVLALARTSVVSYVRYFVLWLFHCKGLHHYSLHQGYDVKKGSANHFTRAPA